MGAAAFIMAEFLEAPYSYVILAAIIPAFLYFTTIYFMVHVEAEKHGIEKIDKSMLPNVLEVLKGWLAHATFFSRFNWFTNIRLYCDESRILGKYFRFLLSFYKKKYQNVSCRFTRRI